MRMAPSVLSICDIGICVLGGKCQEQAQCGAVRGEKGAGCVCSARAAFKQRGDLESARIDLRTASSKMNSL